MSGFIELDNTFICPEGFNIGVLQSIPIHKYFYGQPMDPDPKTLYWTDYCTREEVYDGISFVRKLYIDYQSVAEYVVTYLKTLFPEIPFDFHRVSLLKTKGNVIPHYDESNRKCCVNIGIHNSSISVTKTSAVKEWNVKLFEEMAVSNICKNGYAYLIDTSCMHSVETTDATVERFLFSYAFGKSFEEILSKFHNKPTHHYGVNNGN